MIQLVNHGVFLVNGAPAERADIAPAEARKHTIASRILRAHNISDSEENLRIKFDKLISHDITYVGIIQSARAGGLTRFPLP